MTSVNQNLEFYQGETVGIVITITEDGTAKDITDASAVWAMAKTPGGAPVYSASTVSGIAITDAAAGELTITISATDSAAFYERIYYHELQLTDGASKTSVTTTGQVSVLKSITNQVA